MNTNQRGEERISANCPQLQLSCYSVEFGGGADSGYSTSLSQRKVSIMQVNQSIALSPAQAVDLPQKLIDYVNESRAPLPPIADPDDPLRIDSHGLMRLLRFLEQELAIRVEDDGLDIINFEAARRLGRLINKLTEKRSAGDTPDEVTLQRNIGGLGS